MRDKRPVDELSIEELERILAIKKREARQQQLQRMRRSGRLVAPPQEKVTSSNGTSPVVQAPAIEPAKSAPEVEALQPESTPPVPRPALPRFEDDVDDLDYRATPANEADRARIWKRFVDGMLLIVEVAAVFGLIFIALNLFEAIGRLETETRAAQEMSNATRQAMIPTLEPTPTLRIDQIVLPGGHTYDEETNQGSFNYNEIPAHLLPAVQNQLLRPIVPRPPRTPETALNISIDMGPDRPAINHSIMQGTDWSALQAGVGQALNGATPSSSTGNVVLAAHNDIYGEIFRYLDELEPGHEIFVQTETKVYRYVVTGTEIVDPDDVYVMESQGRPMLTLISCYPYRVNTKRIVVFADRVDI